MKLTRGQSLVTLGLLGAGIDALARRPSRPSADETLTFSPDGRWIARSNAGGLSLYDAETREVRWSVAWKGGVTALAFSADSSTLAALRADNQVTIRDVNTGVRLQSFPVAEPDQNIPGVLALSPSGDWLAVADLDGTIALFHARESRWQRNLVAPELAPPLRSPQIRAMAFSSDGEKLTVLTTGKEKLGFSVVVFQASTGRLVRQFREDRDTWQSAVALAPDGSVFASYDGSEKGGLILLYDLRKSGSYPVGSRYCYAPLQKMTILADSQTLVVFYDGGIVTWFTNNLQEQRMPEQVGSGSTADAMTISPDGKKLAYLAAGQLWVEHFSTVD